MSNLYIYQASAGSGKTHRLVIEYLMLALRYPHNYKSTLAITFTNKATDEMKSRVIEYLVRLSAGDKTEMAKDIMKQLKSRYKLEKDFVLRDRASLVLGNILHDYTNFHISTIDSFCIKVIRSFAKELGLQIGFDIELDAKKVLKEITLKLLDKFSTDENIAQYFENYIVYKLGEGYTWKLEDDIAKIGLEIFSEDYWERRFRAVSGDVYENRESTLKHIEEIKKVKFSFENYLKTKADETIRLITDAGLNSYEYFLSKSRGALNAMEKLSSGKVEITKTVLEIINAGKDVLNIPHPQSGVINKAVAEVVSFYESNLPAYNTADAIAKNIYNIGIFSDLLALLNDYRRENRVLLSNDINNILRKLISDDISPFIYEKTGTRIRNILIDEFQDTSRFQWNNIKPLVVNTLSEKNTAFLVGDVKQSIYRWRGGDMRLLLEKVENDLNGFKDIIEKNTLSENWRSQKEIVEFNNIFFPKFVDKVTARNGSAGFISESYVTESLRQTPDPGKKYGYVNLNFFNDKKGERSTNDESDLKVTEIISEVLNDGYEPSDILVLVRDNKDSLRISKHISSLGYSVVSEKSLLADSSPKVRMLLSLMRYISDNRDALAKTELLHLYAGMNGSCADARKIFEDSKSGYFKSVIPGGFFRDEQKTGFRPVLNELTAFELAEHLIEIFGLADKADPYIISFLDEAYRFSKKSEDDIVSFLEYWETVRENVSVEIPENAGGIRVMTIHKAKGLQGKVVIIPYADWEIDAKGNRDSFWASADEEPFNKAPA
ncbi:MAG: UvrD-helicase domain-containing protein, partial [Ignavibacteria bacterium]|nr:UvrD-helicase domain-containing protein [Ignavibacteria bacterium]